jgi:subtilisin family serine protease
MHDAIKKAKNNNICVFAAASNDLEEDLNFPARYGEVFSTSTLTRGKEKNKKIMKNIDLYTSNKGMYTTYVNNKYVRAYGSSISTAYFAGHAALLIEQYRKTIPKNEIPALVYSKLTREFNGKK